MAELHLSKTERHRRRLYSKQLEGNKQHLDDPVEQ